MLLEDIVEDEGKLWTEGRISWISINRGSSKVKRLHVFDGALCPCVDVSPGGSFERLVAFRAF